MPVCVCGLKRKMQGTNMMHNIFNGAEREEYILLAKNFQTRASQMISSLGPKVTKTATALQF